MANGGDLPDLENAQKNGKFGPDSYAFSSNILLVNKVKRKPKPCNDVSLMYACCIVLNPVNSLGRATEDTCTFLLKARACAPAVPQRLEYGRLDTTCHEELQTA